MYNNIIYKGGILDLPALIAHAYIYAACLYRYTSDYRQF